ncbi:MULTISPECIES: replication initiation protein [Hymenobacter]|uniref:Initiator Replication protein n=1 Tax=Hymenobacter mucosus TaxID=1411120 RepID=A0A239BGV5_9BACT|nr:MULTISPECIES: replication initiation protein [Hymenobacter]MDF7815938.1 replication initiation protein [Hymenobacter sp. YC55]SNS06872.1 Initiator Replication protein [Hymenobacter mucosus]
MNPVTLWQDNALTIARYEMTALEKNILYMVMASIRKDDPVTTVYQVSAKELMALTGEEVKVSDMQRATKKLITRYFETTLSNGDFLQATFVASALYRKGQGIIELELSQKVRPLYVELKDRFTTLQLHTALTLNSKYAKRLYELFSMYKNLPDKTFCIDVQELKQRLDLIDAKTGKDRYEKWTHFKKAALDPAEKEINGKADLSFSYQPIKRGRSVAQIEFTIRYQPNTPIVAYEGPNAAVFGRLTTHLGLRQDQAHKVLSLHPLDGINRHLHKIQLRMLNNELENVGAYTAKIFGV